VRASLQDAWFEPPWQLDLEAVMFYPRQRAPPQMLASEQRRRSAAQGTGWSGQP